MERFIHKLEIEKKRRDDAEEAYSMLTAIECAYQNENNDDDHYMNSTMNRSDIPSSLTTSCCNRSGQVCAKHMGVDVSIQTEPSVPDRTKLRIKENISMKSSRSVLLWSTCRVSVEMSQKIVQVACKELYNHNVYMSPADQLAGESVGTEV